MDAELLLCVAFSEIDMGNAARQAVLSTSREIASFSRPTTTCHACAPSSIGDFSD